MTKINKLHFNGIDYDIGDKDIHDLTAKSTLVDNDEFMLADSGDSYNSKKATLDNITSSAIGSMYSESTCADGDLTISAGNVTCWTDHYFMCAKEWNFNNFTVCPGITVHFCGNDEPVIKVGGTFCNLGVIDTYGPKTEDCINFLRGNLYAEGIKDRPAFECSGGKGNCSGATLYSGDGGGIGESGCSGSGGHAGGAGTTYAGGGGASNCRAGCAANNTCGGNGANGSNNGGGGGFGLTKGGNGGTGPLLGGGGGYSLYGTGGNGGGATNNATGIGGDGGNSLYGTGGNGGLGGVSGGRGGVGGCGRNGGTGGTVGNSGCNRPGKGGDAYSWHFGLTVIANDFYNCCIDAHGGDGGNGGCRPNYCAYASDGGAGGDGGNVTVLYHNMCCRGDINVKGGCGGLPGTITNISTSDTLSFGRTGKSGSDGTLIIGQI